MIQLPRSRTVELARVLVPSLALAACSAAPDPLRAYLSDDRTRRSVLLGALWFRDNDYARLRLRRFASGTPDDWGRLPLWLPSSAAVRDGAAQAIAALDASVGAADGPALEQALLRLGQAAFFDYPAQLVGGFDELAGSAVLAQAYGLWRGRAPQDPPLQAPRIGGLLRVALPGGSALALSCASCHASTPPGAPDCAEPGRPNQRLNIGALAQDQAPAGVTVPGATWGPGRVDVSPDGINDPAEIPDLRVVAVQRYLHHDATLRNDDLAAPPLALALRIETLLITSQQEQARPPPAVALGLALYLRSLAPPARSGLSQGRALFMMRCGGCHEMSGGAGEPVPLAVVGTDATLGQSSERGTGSYRIPALRALADRGPLLHDGQLPDLAALLDPSRQLPDYQGGMHGPGPVLGHSYGLDLSVAERADVAAFVAGL